MLKYLIACTILGIANAGLISKTIVINPPPVVAPVIVKTAPVVHHIETAPTIVETKVEETHHIEEEPAVIETKVVEAPVVHHVTKVVETPVVHRVTKIIQAPVVHKIVTAPVVHKVVEHHVPAVTIVRSSPTFIKSVPIVKAAASLQIGGGLRIGTW